MKFCESYESYMKQLGKTLLPEIGYRRLKKIINKCTDHVIIMSEEEAAFTPSNCSVCDGTIFPSLDEEMSCVVDYFEKEARKLLSSNDPPLLSCSSWKYYLCFYNCSSRNDHDHDVLVKEGLQLLNYAMINAIAFRRILEKYDKVHNKCGNGVKFKSGGRSNKHMEIVQSPWFYELMSFLINSSSSSSSSSDREFKETSQDASLIYEGLAALTFNNNQDRYLSMSCGLSESFRVDVNLNCPICLDVVFDAVALKCGHILCHTCACAAASVTIVDGLKAATPKHRCPLCRQARVYDNAIHLKELNILLSKRCPKYWERRLESERVERLRLVKEHWQSQVNSLIS